MPEQHQPLAGPQQLLQSCANAGDMCSVLAVELCQHPVTGGHSEVAAWPMGGPSPVTHGAAAPGALTIRPCLRSRCRCWQREALGSCLPSAWRGWNERAVRPLQPSPEVLSNLQSIRSPLKLGGAPASPWEKTERSLRPAGRGKETWPRATGCRSLCSCSWGCAGVGSGSLGQCQLHPQL